MNRVYTIVRYAPYTTLNLLPTCISTLLRSQVQQKIDFQNTTQKENDLLFSKFYKIEQNIFFIIAIIKNTKTRNKTL